MSGPEAPPSAVFATVQYRYDAFSVYEGMNYLFKKAIGYPNTTPQGALLNEMVDNDNSFPFITINKIYNQPIPQSNLPFNNYIFDPSFSNITFKFKTAAFTIPFSDPHGKRYYSSNYPYIAYYSNILLETIGTDTGEVNTGGAVNTIKYNDEQVVSYGHPLLVNAIPVTYAPYNNGTPGSYTTILLTSNIGSQVRIFPKNGYWLLDTDSGLVTFYDSNTTIKLGAVYGADGNIIGYNRPRISFYRYEGIMGSTNVANTQDF